MQTPFRTLVLLPMAGLIVACSQHATDINTPQLAIELRDDVLGLYDTMTVAVRLHEHGTWRTPPDMELTSRDQDVVRVEHTDGFGLRLKGTGLGDTWLVARGGGLTDSLRIEVKLLPIGVAGFAFDKGEYRPAGSMDFCFTHADQDFTQVAGFVVDGHYKPLWQATEWSLPEQDVLEVRVPDDRVHDRLIRPAAPGRTSLQIHEGVYSGTIEVQVFEQGCPTRTTTP